MTPRKRHWLSSILLGLAALVAIVAALGSWANRQLLDTDEWVDTSSQLLREPAIQDATAAYLADQLVDGPTIRDRLEEGLPPRLRALSGPLAAGTGELAERTAKRLIASGAFQKLWRETNRNAHQQLLRVIEGDTLLTRGGIVIDLRPQLGVLAQRLGVVPNATGDHGKVHVLRGDNLATVRKAVDALNTLRWVSIVLLLALLVAAVWVAPDRGHAILGAGVALVLAGTVLLVVRRAGGTYIVDKLVAGGADEPAATASWRVATSLLRDIAGALVVVGALGVLSGWLAGASRWARSVRAFAAPALTDHVGLVVGGVAIALFALLAAGLLPAAGSLWAIVLYAALAIAGVFALRRQVEREAAT